MYRPARRLASPRASSEVKRKWHWVRFSGFWRVHGLVGESSSGENRDPYRVLARGCAWLITEALVSADKSSNLAARLATAGVAGPLILSLLFLGPTWGWYALVLVATLLAAHELFAMTHTGDLLAQLLGAACTALLSLAVYFGQRDPRILPSAVLVVPVLGGLLALFRFGEIRVAALRLMSGIAAPFYVGGLLATLALLRRDFADDGPSLVLLCLLVGWMGDTGGYFFGRYLGKTKLHEVISPKKTRAGFVGSCLFAGLSAVAVQVTLLSEWSSWQLATLGVLGGAFGQLGDLMESLLKRSTGVKDSGSLIPGHGGMLDRIDALLVVAPMVYLYALWLGPH
jgi:phosphatidate cytidylyltransferase